MQGTRTKLVTAAAVEAAVVGGAAFANAATSGSSGPQRFDPSKGGHTANGRTETLLSGDTASKVRAAALAKVSGTVERVETNVDSSAPYEAHIRKSDGTSVEVQVNRDFTVAAVNNMPGHP